MTTIPVLTTDTVLDYLRERPPFAGDVDLDTASVVEVGDGNLNLVFIVTDSGGRSVVLKQSLPYVRLVGESWPLSQDRILAEARAYEVAARVSPDTIPAYRGLDHDRRVIGLEDLSAWTVWRRALNEGWINRGAAAAIGRHVARVAFATGVHGRDAAEHKLALAASINIDLCQITEDLVFTQPYIDHPDNSWLPALDADVRSLREGGLVDEIVDLKHAFMTQAEGLVHGDLHTGSVFVPAGPSEGPVPAKIFDLEFAFYGPIAFDLGAFFGNVLLAQARAAVLDRPAEFRHWLAGLVDEAWQAFEQEYRALWPARVDASFTDTHLDRWLRRVWHDAIGFGGAKAIRRIVGLAKVSDIESLDEPDREVAARAVLQIARTWVEQRRDVDSPAALDALTTAALAAVRA